MRRTPRWLRRALARSPLPLALGALAAGCGGPDAPLPTQQATAGPARAVSLAAPSPRDTIEKYLGLVAGQGAAAIFPNNGPRAAAITQWNAIRAAFEGGDRARARTGASGLASYALRLLARGGLLDPYGSTVRPPRRGGADAFVRALYAYTEQAVPDPIDEQLDRNVKTYVIGPAGGKGVEPNAYLFDVPPGAVSQPTTFTVEVLPDGPSPLPGFGAPGQPPAFPYFIDIATDPQVGLFAAPVRVALCSREPGEGGPPTSSYDRLRIGHGLNGITEVLELASAADLPCAGHEHSAAPFGRPGDGLLARGASTLRWLAGSAARAALPARLLALHAGKGGLIRTTSPLGTIDPGAEAPATTIVTPRDTTVLVGDQVALAAVLRDADSRVTYPATFTFQSLNPDTASVSASGVVTAVRAGRATIAVSALPTGGGVARPVVAFARVTFLPRIPAPAFGFEGLLNDAGTGAPLPEGELRLSLIPGSPVPFVTTTSGPTGRYELTVPAGATFAGTPITLSASRIGYQPLTIPLTVPTVPGDGLDTRDVALVAIPGRHAAGAVRDSVTGARLASTLVRYVGGTTFATTTAASGLYLLDLAGLPAGGGQTDSMTASRAGYRGTGRLVTRPAVGTLPVTLWLFPQTLPTGWSAVQGTAYDGALRLAGARVCLYQPRAGASPLFTGRHAVTDALGRYRLLVPPGAVGGPITSRSTLRVGRAGCGVSPTVSGSPTAESGGWFLRDLRLPAR